MDSETANADRIQTYNYFRAALDALHRWRSIRWDQDESKKEFHMSPKRNGSLNEAIRNNALTPGMFSHFPWAEEAFSTEGRTRVKKFLFYSKEFRNLTELFFDLAYIGEFGYTTMEKREQDSLIKDETNLQTEEELSKIPFSMRPSMVFLPRDTEFRIEEALNQLEATDSTLARRFQPTQRM